MDYNLVKTILFLLVTMVLFCSFNCNGMKNVNNFKNFVSVMNDRNVSFSMLQETFWNDDYVNSIRNMYEGIIYDNNGVNNRQGVAILVNNSYKDKTKVVFKDNLGRFIHVSYEEDENTYNFISLYAPNNIKERCIFFTFVNNYINNLENLIIGGDFNTTLSKFDKSCQSKHCMDEAYRELQNMINICNIYDVWRCRNETKRIFSWKRISNGVLQQSRIDFYLTSKSLSPNIQNVYYNETSFSDHTYVFMNFKFCNVERGPGLWVLNNTLLSNEYYVKRVKEIIEEALQCPLYNKEPLVWWDNLKYRIKRFSQIFSGKMAKDKRKNFYDLQNKIQRLCAVQANGGNINLEVLENLKLELSNYELEKCKGAILRSKAIWATEGDKNTKYFLNLEKYKQENNAIKELFNDNNEIVSDTEGILEIEYNFYKNLYSCVEIDNDKMDQFLESVDTVIDNEDKEMCDNDITYDEIARALTSMSKNKSPGTDGLTTEFYCKFYDSLEDILYKVFNAVHEEGTLSRSMRAGVISLVYKKKGDRRILKNYRPISLLQVDYKILARIMADRFKTVLPKIISENQTCCIIGRDISNNIANVRDVITMVENDELEGYLLKIDQEKAFDRESHEYLFNVLRKFGFGQVFVRWIQIFYNNINSAVKCNGFLTNYFAIKNGIRQGCPISALLYVLAAEPLRCNIEKNPKIKGIEIPGSEKEAVIFQHADDTTLTVSNKESIPEVFKVFDLYSASSGSKINVQKSEMLPIGRGYLSGSEKTNYSLKICEREIVLLGVYIGKDNNLCHELNWRLKVNKIKSLLNLWLQRKLTIQGRVTVVESLCMSRLWYTMFVTSIPSWVIDELKVTCVNFVWNNGAHLVHYNSIIDEKSKGVLHFPDIKSKLMAFRLKFLARFLDEDYHVLWKDIFKYFCSKILHMNLGKEMLFMEIPGKYLSSLPEVYREMLKSLDFIREQLIFNVSIENIYDQPLFCNPKIVINEKSLLWQDFIKAGIIQLKDLCYEVKPGFLPVSAVIEILKSVNEDCNVYDVTKKWHLLISALPHDWIKTINTEVNITTNKREIDIELNMNGKLLDFKMCSTKRFYQIIIQNFCKQPKCIEKWQNQFHVDPKDFYSIWKNVNHFWKPSNMIELDFKIAHQCIFTNERLMKMNLSDSSYCAVCQNDVETFLHLFIDCEKLSDFHLFLEQKIETLFENCNSDKMSLVVYERILLLGISGSIKGVNTNFVNFMLSVARYCIFKRRNLANFDKRNMNLTHFFCLTLKHYVSYFYEYLCSIKNMRRVFWKNFLENNTIVQETNDVIVFNL